MRGALIHGVLLAVMLVYGYRTWTRDKGPTVTVGDVVLWDKTEADLVSLEWKSEKKIVKLERKADYWWGMDTTIDRKPKPPKPGDSAGSGSAAGSGSDAGSGSAAAGSGSGSGSAAPPVEYDETRKTREFPLGENGDKLVKTYTAARALRELGKPNDEAKKDYKLTDSKSTLTITFKGGSRTFLIGGAVYGGSDRYGLDQASGVAYVLSKDMVSGLEIGETSLKLTDPRGFAADKLASVTIDAGTQSKTAVRMTAGGGDDAKQVKTWGDPVTNKPNQTIANFIDNANNLRPTEYVPDLKPSGEPIVKLTYRDEHNAVLGTLSLYKRDNPVPAGTVVDPANPPKPVTEYYIVTPKTRVPAIVRSDSASRAENDVPTVFSDKPVDSVPPKGNPFGKVDPSMLENNGSGAAPGPGGAAPPMNPHGGAPMNPHGGGPMGPGPGSAAAPVPTPGPAAPPAKVPAVTPAPTPRPAPKKVVPAPAPAEATPPAPAPAPAEPAPAQ